MGETAVLVTGAFGFLGSNLCTILRQRGDIVLHEFGKSSPPEQLEKGLQEADVIFHLAGVNRPDSIEEFEKGNADFTGQLCERLESLSRKPAIVFASSIQADLDNPYGVSKRRAEEMLRRFGESAGARITIFRLKNVFGKWCRPNYNSVVATFCHNVARGLPITISDAARTLELVYVDDVCSAMLEAAGLNGESSSLKGKPFSEVAPVFTTSLGTLAERIQSFRELRRTLRTPALDDPFIVRLYATYLSYLEPTDFAYQLDIKADQRGSLAEFIKSPSFGQIFVSHTKPGITRGDHYHHTKAEKFLVLQGEAVIRFRHMRDGSVVEYPVSGREYKVLDIPPGYTHSIENVGDVDLVTLFWADELFDPERPDTCFERVIPNNDNHS